MTRHGITRRARAALGLATLIGAATVAPRAEAKPIAPGLICDTYPGAPSCLGGSPDCRTCHEKTTKPVVLNRFGSDVSAALLDYTESPFGDAPFADFLPFALTDVEAVDSDGDGFDNATELLEGTLPGDSKSVPGKAECPEDITGLVYPICQYDRSFAYRKLAIDFCGLPPTFDELETFRGLDSSAQDAELHAKLDACLETQFWVGFDGVLWSLAHEKIRPLTAFFDDEQNFFADYALFVWTQIDGNDVRDMLTAQYHVTIETPLGNGDTSVLRYRQQPTLFGQPLAVERRAGMLTLAWPLFYNTMFTALPRATAAQAYRAFLGLDIAKSEGLDWPIPNEPADYDNAGVQEAECAGCHSTLDPLSYPFATYNGLQADAQIGPFEYEPDRIEKHFGQQFPDMLNMPEAGYIFGEPVADLIAWGEVAANSDPFFRARAADYWTLLMGETPNPENSAAFEEFTALWENLSQTHSVEAMLHELVETEAYGAP